MKKPKYVEVIPNFEINPGQRFFVPKGKRFGNQLEAALQNGWTVRSDLTRQLTRAA